MRALRISAKIQGSTSGWTARRAAKRQRRIGGSSSSGQAAAKAIHPESWTASASPSASCGRRSAAASRIRPPSEVMRPSSKAAVAFSRSTPGKQRMPITRKHGLGVSCGKTRLRVRPYKLFQPHAAWPPALNSANVELIVDYSTFPGAGRGETEDVVRSSTNGKELNGSTCLLKDKAMRRTAPASGAIRIRKLTGQ